MQNGKYRYGITIYWAKYSVLLAALRKYEIFLCSADKLLLLL